MLFTMIAWLCHGWREPVESGRFTQVSNEVEFSYKYSAYLPRIRWGLENAASTQLQNSFLVEKMAGTILSDTWAVQFSLV